MIRFYDYLKKDLPKPQALQQAKLDYLRNIKYQENGHPFLLGSFHRQRQRRAGENQQAFSLLDTLDSRWGVNSRVGSSQIKE